MKKVYRRKSIRLKGYDYSQNGAYFVTICTQHREHLFGRIVDGKMMLNHAGKIAQNELQKTLTIRKNMDIYCFVIMPNHIHFIVVIVGAYCNTPLPVQFISPSNNLGSMIRGYKSTVTKQINKFRKTPKRSIWQRNYYEHIIRNAKSLGQISEYIFANPKNWENDMFFQKI